MEYSSYISEQIGNVDKALRLAKRAYRTTESLQDFFQPQQDAENDRGVDAFSRDTFKYFDANSALRDLESLQLQLGDLKTKLIEIKIANDKLLYAGGYQAFIDDTIARIFLKNTLCKLEAQNERTPFIIEDTIHELEGLRKQLCHYGSQRPQGS